MQEKNASKNVFRSVWIRRLKRRVPGKPDCSPGNNSQTNMPAFYLLVKGIGSQKAAL
jgi:hypothetical protein